MITSDLICLKCANSWRAEAKTLNEWRRKDFYDCPECGEKGRTLKTILRQHEEALKELLVLKLQEYQAPSWAEIFKHLDAQEKANDSV